MENDSNEEKAIKRFETFSDDNRNVFPTKIEEVGSTKSITHELKLDTDKSLKSRYFKTKRKTQKRRHLQENNYKQLNKSQIKITKSTKQIGNLTPTKFHQEASVHKERASVTDKGQRLDPPHSRTPQSRKRQNQYIQSNTKRTRN